MELRAFLNAAAFWFLVVAIGVTLSASTSTTTTIKQATDNASRIEYLNKFKMVQGK